MPTIRPLSRAFLALAVVTVASVASAGCRREAVAPDAGPEIPVAQVRVAPAADGGPVPAEIAMGTVRARHHAAVASRVTAQIESLAVAPGSRVEAGDVVALLDARDLRARLDQAVAQRDRASTDLERLARLARDGAAPPAELDAARERRTVAAAALAEAETSLAHARVVAPFAGVVTRKWLDAGDQASPGHPIVEIEQLGELRLEIDVPESLVARVPLGTRLSVRLGPEGDAFDGIVSEVGPVADPSTRTFSVKLDVSESPAIRPGAFGSASIPAGKSTSPRVPASALVHRGQMEIVFVAADGRAGLRLVRAGRSFDGNVELVSGVAAGEMVVVDGAASLVDGQPIEVRR